MHLYGTTMVSDGMNMAWTGGSFQNDDALRGMDGNKDALHNDVFCYRRLRRRRRHRHCCHRRRRHRSCPFNICSFIRQQEKRQRGKPYKHKATLLQLH